MPMPPPSLKMPSWAGVVGLWPLQGHPHIHHSSRNLSPCAVGGSPGRAGGRGTSPRTAAPAAGRVLKGPGSSQLRLRVGTFLLEKRVASSSTETSCSQSAVNTNALLHTPATALGSRFLCQDPLAAGRVVAYLRDRGVTHLLLTWLLEIDSALFIFFQNNSPHPTTTNTPFLSWCETMVI